MVAFANTDGGRLLVGVKDNGAIAGVRSEEEIFMAEGAARLYCQPEVTIKVEEWKVDGKTILEIIIDPSPLRPHLAPDPAGTWKAYVRQGDQNFIANSVLLQVWKRQKETKGTLIRYREEEKLLLEYLERKRKISTGKFQKIAGISRKKAETILVNFIMLGFIELKYEGEQVYYYIKS